MNVDPKVAAFSIMFVSVGFSCFIWQSIRSGWMFYKIYKPIHGIVFAQAVLGVILTFCTLLTSLVHVDCKFILFFSIIAVNVGDITLQAVLLWKAYLGNNRSKIILIIGTIPLIGIAVFIIANLSFAQSTAAFSANVCNTDYPTSIVIIKAALDFTSNGFLSGCFILVIYRHYRVLGGSSPILYTIDWYLASYLIIKQLKYGRNELDDKSREEDDDDDEDDDDESHINNILHNNSNSHLNQQQPISPNTFSTIRTDHHVSQNMILERPISLLLKDESHYIMDENRRIEEKLTGEKKSNFIV
ncbi:hypothetical protein BDC45DRAFT_445733 [Circinella umbellata]|nr:hypothetical protein BDC45DRAFT_445733 [Circinella umbellata]